MSLQASEDNTSQVIARLLLDANTVLFRPDRPFFFSSGWASPVYVNCKQLLSYPNARDQIIEHSIKRIQLINNEFKFDGIAGIDGAGVPFASILADRLKLPLIIVRKQARGLGPRAQTSGEFKSGARLLLVDDVTTDGKTKAEMGSVLRRAGAIVECAFVVFQYGIFESVVNEKDLGIALQSLLSWQELLQYAHNDGHFSPKILSQIEAYILDPSRWSFEHGGISVAQFHARY